MTCLPRRKRWALRCLLAAPLLTSLLVNGSGAAAAEFAGEPSQETVLIGAPDPTGVAVTGAGGETVYYVAATGRGVKLLRSTDLKQWRPVGRVFDARVPDWARREVPGASGVWAPDLSFHDGLYHLYYSVSTMGSQRSVIGEHLPL